ncbi:MAG TPA: PEP/pyruvate-binding domain-containing protein, partial [Chloroflexota bacterium]|nr:PEP/pyruvate-binding domain-containing protein [Chloroflexota bacterium]
MPTAPLRSTTPAIDVYVKLAQYPILCDRIRLRMREELFQRGIIAKTDFEQEIKHLATESQRREGLNDPLSQEDESAWQRRLAAIRDYHTDALFANNLGISLLEHIVEDILRNQHVTTSKTELTFNPEVAPWPLLFQQGENYDALPPPQQEKIKHHLEEIKVVLIKRLMSDQLPFIAVAKNVFTIRDLRWVYERLIGRGKIGGKASGMVLAWKILQLNRAELGPDLRPFVHVPDTFFIGSEMIYEFLYLNKLERFVNQKYLPDAERQEQYPKIVAACLAGELPDFLVEHLREVLVQFHGRPFIVRSSSLLEDHLDYAFAGKYATVFCPNQGAPAENLADLANAIRRIYASTFDPNAMREREKYGLIDYDERMAIMIQPLVGERHGRY